MIKCSTLCLLIAFFSCVTVSCTNKGVQENTTASSETVTTASFKVSGNCEMCKETIEGAVKVAGVLKADWNTETKQIEVTFDTTKISLDQIQKKVAAAGYDNEKYRSDEKAYSSLPECCQYERK